MLYFSIEVDCGNLTIWQFGPNIVLVLGQPHEKGKLVVIPGRKATALDTTCQGGCVATEELRTLSLPQGFFMH